MRKTFMNRLTCELCSSQATTYCESDQARLCWHCDSKVHKANFLVSKHSRTLLCHLCQNPTPWSASGPMLPPSLSVCVCCASANSRAGGGGMNQSQSLHTQQVDHDSHHDENDGVYDSNDEDGDVDMEDDDDEEEYSSYSGNDVEEEDNQVVPLTSPIISTKVGAAQDNSCSSSTEADDDCDNDADGRISSLLPSAPKRMRQSHMLT